MSPADPATIAFYDRDADAYAQSAVDHGVRDSLRAFEARLPRAARVLDLGCGGGHESVWLAEHGHNVTSMDASPGLAAEAKRRFGIEVRVADFTALDDIAAYDGVWSGAALHHATTEELTAIIAAIARALKPGGAFGALLKAGHDRRDGLGRFYCGIDADGMRALLADAAQWAGAEVQQTVGSGYDQVETPWLIVSARRT
ncbi:MAG: class I SAM-dependent methyltransferase [Hyphomonadaceae bacterium]|nr:class I SAM-dependent methyltransferase [Hyphomonadaceae bacterium]